jgi:hypothetical protein
MLALVLVLYPLVVVTLLLAATAGYSACKLLLGLPGSGIFLT